MVVKLLSNYLTKTNYFRVGGAFSPRMIVAKSKFRFDCYNKDVCISRRVLSTKVEKTTSTICTVIISRIQITITNSNFFISIFW